MLGAFGLCRVRELCQPLHLVGKSRSAPAKTAYPLLTSPPNEATQIVSGVSVGSV